jgi:hypothetical protein
MKPSKAKHGVRVVFPEPASWANIVRDCKLTDAQANTLEITLKEALDEIDRYYSKLQNRPSRDVQVKHLKLFEKALKGLQNECQRSANLMEFFLPSDTLGFIGESLTFLAMSEALGRDVFPKNYDFRIEFKQSQGKRITLASVEQDTRPMREALGLKHGHLILRYFIERIHRPLERWIELDRLNEGGRPPDAVRRHQSIASPKRPQLSLAKPPPSPPRGSSSICVPRSWSHVDCQKVGSRRLFRLKSGDCVQTKRNGVLDTHHDCQCFRPET